MRHRKNFNHLGRKVAHRKAMLANMATSLILHKRITTTVPKAKALKVYVEPLITRSKSDTTHSRRMVFSMLKDKYAVSELFREIAVKVADRPGGYTRILKTGKRLGDNADMCIIELVDYNETYVKEAKAAKKPATRRSRRGATKPADAPVEEVVKEVVEEVNAEVVEETKVEATEVVETEVKEEEPKAEATEEKPEEAKKEDSDKKEE